MFQLHKNIDLKPYNTFGIRASADGLVEFSNAVALIDYLEHNPLPESYFILGGGSNLLFTGNYSGWLFYPNIPGLHVVKENRHHIWLEAGAGVTWDNLVAFAVGSGWGGVENLSGIPGMVGATPVQNIGAYGAEVGERIERVKAIDLLKKKEVTFSRDECCFAYRNSLFKNERKNQVVVTSVVYKLDKSPVYNLDYGSLKAEVERQGTLSLSTIRQTIMSIRDSKLPDYHTIGNAGSFFKNPVLDRTRVESLMEQYPGMPVYTTPDREKRKLAAGWLIDQCGWRGYREGDAGVHPGQALVLVNYGEASGRDIFHLSEKIRQSVSERFGVLLEPEVNIL
ncbi:MAG TPA: UDP-N-acetylmuramate dehydrogenase [Prolixibacteraceae bacterium]|nr:UDP-N-acetylmuramate dehydrogenase [Prolixibacteraceae bacterium]